MQRIIVLVWIFAGLILLAQPESVPVPSADRMVSADLQALFEMSKEARREHLRAMSPSDRRGVWVKLKREERAREGKLTRTQRNRRGKMEVTPVDVTPGDAWLSPKEAVGTVQYDSGMPLGFLGTDGYVGNRFNSHTGLPMTTSGTISTIQAFLLAGPGLSSPGYSVFVYGPANTMGTALQLFSTFNSTGLSGTATTITFTGLGLNYSGNSFYVMVGDFTSSYMPAVGAGTTMGQGYHGVESSSIGSFHQPGPPNEGTTMGGPFVPLTSQNVFVRVSGNIVPVELMTFEIE